MFTLITILVIDNFNNGVVIRPNMLKRFKPCPAEDWEILNCIKLTQHYKMH
jgi:hypothetical protein